MNKSIIMNSVLCGLVSLSPMILGSDKQDKSTDIQHAKIQFRFKQLDNNTLYHNLHPGARFSRDRSQSPTKTRSRSGSTSSKDGQVSYPGNFNWNNNFDGEANGDPIGGSGPLGKDPYTPGSSDEEQNASLSFLAGHFDISDEDHDPFNADSSPLLTGEPRPHDVIPRHDLTSGALLNRQAAPRIPADPAKVRERERMKKQNANESGANPLSKITVPTADQALGSDTWQTVAPTIYPFATILDAAPQNINTCYEIATYAELPTGQYEITYQTNEEDQYKTTVIQFQEDDIQAVKTIFSGNSEIECHYFKLDNFDIVLRWSAARPFLDFVKGSDETSNKSEKPIENRNSLFTGKRIVVGGAMFVIAALAALHIYKIIDFSPYNFAQFFNKLSPFARR